jgi:hypothetical protein
LLCDKFNALFGISKLIKVGTKYSEFWREASWTRLSKCTYSGTGRGKDGIYDLEMKRRFLSKMIYLLNADLFQVA